MPSTDTRGVAAPAVPPVPSPLPWIAALLPIALLLSMPLCAHAQSTIGECEKIQAADAYNQCLAKFGPEQKSQNLAPERPSDMKNSSEEAAAGAGRFSPAPRVGTAPRGHRRYGAYRVYGGRKRMTIPVRGRHR